MISWYHCLVNICFFPPYICVVMVWSQEWQVGTFKKMSMRMLSLTLNRFKVPSLLNPQNQYVNYTSRDPLGFSRPYPVEHHFPTINIHLPHTNSPKHVEIPSSPHIKSSRGVSFLHKPFPIFPESSYFNPSHSKHHKSLLAKGCGVPPPKNSDVDTPIAIRNPRSQSNDYTTK